MNLQIYMEKEDVVERAYKMIKMAWKELNMTFGLKENTSIASATNAYANTVYGTMKLNQNAIGKEVIIMVEKTEEVMETFVDFLNAIEAACVNAKQHMKSVVGITETAGLTWNPNKIKWYDATGTAGLYERSEDVNSPDFKAMLKDLADHNGKLRREGYFYWLFQNGTIVGRKQMKA